MAIIKEIQGKLPALGKNIFLAENAVLTGDIIIGDNCSVWYHAVLRGDVQPIRIGDRTNIQDGVMIHGSVSRIPVTIGNDVTIGHHAIVHGCTVGNAVLIGMGAIILDEAIIGDGAIIAAGSVVLEKTIVPPGALFAGIPAKQMRENDPELFAEQMRKMAAHYVKVSGWYNRDT